MLIIRPVELKDLDDIVELAKKSGKGMTSLPPCAETLEQRIQLSIDSFNRNTPKDSDYFLLVMEDLDCNRVVGTAGVYSRTGSRQAFYAYRLMSVTHYSHSLNKETRSELLHLTNDYTGYSEVGTLFVDPDYRGNGRWLARARYLLMGQFPERFAPFVIAELRGQYDEDGKSPFWDAIGRKFFEMEFDEADALSGTGSNQFITELMPKHPIYTCMLPDEAKKSIGVPHSDGIKALQLLEKEGFFYEKVLDIFDGGPILKARLDQLRSVRRTEQGIALKADSKLLTEPTLIATSSLNKFRVVRAKNSRTGTGEIKIEQETFDALNAKPGDLLRYIQR